MLNLDVPAAEIEARRQRWQPPESQEGPGTLRKYAALVSSASTGAVTSNV
jgi:dihydroxy-acid dehydratase